ncbi:MAG: tRNA lysidine(34) synthetase TilS [Geodermatophilaceae bacterium]
MPAPSPGGDHGARLDPDTAGLRQAVRTVVARHVAAGEPLTVACSGGADSLALAAAVAFEARRRGLLAGAVTVDHGLQAGSAIRAERIGEQLRGLGLDPVRVVTVRVQAAGRHSPGSGGPEGRARTARYDALTRDQAQRGGWVLLGHTLDDQAETVLLGLARGSGPRSLAGMQPARRPWLRPLLGVRRSTTRAACSAAGLTWWDDPHNDDPAYTRVRLRHEVLPLLEDVLHGGVAAALARTAALIREDCAALDELAAALAPEPAGVAEITVLAAERPALRRRALRRWLYDVGGLTSAHLAAVDALVIDWRGQGPFALPNGWQVARRDGRLHRERPGTTG